MSISGVYELAAAERFTCRSESFTPTSLINAKIKINVKRASLVSTSIVIRELSYRSNSFKSLFTNIINYCFYPRVAREKGFQNNKLGKS